MASFVYRLSIVCCFLAAVSAVALPSQGQEPTKPAKPKPPATTPPGKPAPVKPAAAKPAPAKPVAVEAPPAEKVVPSIDNFEVLYDEAQEIVGEINKLEQEFRKSKESERPALVNKYQELAAGLNERAGQLIELQPAIEALYQKDPKANKKAEQFLAERVIRAIEGDDYEEAVRLGQSLLAGGFDDPRIHQAIGMAAFNMQDVELTEKELKKAKELKALEEDGKFILAMLPDFREDWDKELAIRAAEAKADDLPRVKLATSKGDIVIELFENEAPNAVANFISLVEKEFYNGIPFHRVLPGFMAQGGDPEGNGTGGPGYHIACECHGDNYRKHYRGTLSMAHAGRDTGGSQFFLTFRPTSHLDGKHTAFGRVIEGMGVLKDLQRINPQFQGGPEPDKIEIATVLRKRNHKYEPQKVDDQTPSKKPE